MNNLQERINRAANVTWQAIGDAVLKVDNAGSLPREDVVATVIDCDYLETHGGDAEAVAAFRKLTPDKQREMLLKAFPAKHYGW